MEMHQEKLHKVFAQQQQACESVRGVIAACVSRRNSETCTGRSRTSQDLIQNVKRPKSWKDDPKPRPSLEQMLQDERTLKSFQDFLRSEFSDENVEFWLACEDYRSSSSADELQRKARSIYDKFIQPTACREINIDHKIKEEISKSLEKPSVCCFDQAQKHIYMLMERDSCPRFLLSDAYLRLTHKSKTLWYI